MKAIVTSVFALALVGAILTAPVIAQQTAPAPANPPAAAGPQNGPGPGYGPGWGPGMMMGPGMMGWGGPGGMGVDTMAMCNPRAAGLAEWRMERIERLVKPTDAQRTALDALKTASAKAAESITVACPREFPANASARMALTEKRLEVMLAAVKTVRPAFDAFYATLNDEQKARIDSGGPRRWGWHGWRRGT
jgi:predicted lipid-binding transport protein (Tim44 family)